MQVETTIRIGDVGVEVLVDWEIDQYNEREITSVKTADIHTDMTGIASNEYVKEYLFERIDEHLEATEWK